MLRFNRTLISFAAAFFIAVMLMSARCFAFDYASITGSTATGANITGYKSAIAVDVTDFGADNTGQEDSYTAIQNALFYAVDNASDTVQLKVIIPAGTYIINKPLKIYSNTWLYMEGATIIRNFSSGYMFRNALQNPAGGYDGDRNIIIEGGCFDGNTNSSSTAFSNLRFGHIKNLWIKNVEIKNNANGHHLEIGGAKNVTIENCEFHGYMGTKEKEAIQLDTMNNSDVFVHFEPFDDTSCENIVIRNNDFHDLMRGLGSHSATIGVYYTNILITGNTFENLTSCAMIMQNYKNCLVENNTMTNVGYGIDFKYMTLIEYVGYNPPVDGYDGINDKIDDFANTIIRKNTISVNSTSYASDPFAIQIYGRKLQGSYYPDYDYKVEGVKITDNKITTTGAAIILNDTNGIQVKSNEINAAKTTEYDSDLIIAKLTSNSTLQNNEISGGSQSGIYVGGSAEITVKENTCTDVGASGVYVSLGASDITVSKNTIESAKGSGIKVTKEAQATITDNKVVGSQGCGILFSNGAGLASGNEVSDGSSDAICVEGEVEVQVISNKLLNNAGSAVKAADKAAVTVGSNEYSDNDGGDNVVSGGAAISVEAVGGLSADEVYEEHIQLSWQTVSEADAYSVCRRLKDSQDDYEEVAEVFSTSYVDLGLTSKTMYEYKVYGVINVGEQKFFGGESDTLEVRTKASVTDCTTDLPQLIKYTGRAAEPQFNVLLDGDVLTNNVDYKVRFTNNTAVGTASAIIVGCGQYCGIKEINFDIVFTESTDDTEADLGASTDKAKSFTSVSVADGQGKSVKSEIQTVIESESEFGKTLEKSQTITASGSDNYLISSLDKQEQVGFSIKSRRVTGSIDNKTYGLWV